MFCLYTLAGRASRISCLALIAMLFLVRTGDAQGVYWVQNGTSAPVKVVGDPSYRLYSNWGYTIFRRAKAGGGDVALASPLTFGGFKSPERAMEALESERRWQTYYDATYPNEQFHMYDDAIAPVAIINGTLTSTYGERLDDAVRAIEVGSKIHDNIKQALGIAHGDLDTLTDAILGDAAPNLKVGGMLTEYGKLLADAMGKLHDLQAGMDSLVGDRVGQIEDAMREIETSLTALDKAALNIKEAVPSLADTRVENLPDIRPVAEDPIAKSIVLGNGHTDVWIFGKLDDCIGHVASVAAYIPDIITEYGYSDQDPSDIANHDHEDQILLQNAASGITEFLPQLNPAQAQYFYSFIGSAAGQALVKARIEDDKRFTTDNQAKFLRPKHTVDEVVTGLRQRIKKHFPSVTDAKTNVATSASQTRGATGVIKKLKTSVAQMPRVVSELVHSPRITAQFPVEVEQGLTSRAAHYRATGNKMEALHCLAAIATIPGHRTSRQALDKKQYPLLIALNMRDEAQKMQRRNQWSNSEAAAIVKNSLPILGVPGAGRIGEANISKAGSASTRLASRRNVNPQATASLITELSKTNPSLPVIMALVSKGGDVNAIGHPNWMNSSALMVAANTGNAACVRTLLDTGADVNLVDPATGNTALLAGASCGDAHLLSVLIEHGADVNASWRSSGTFHAGDHQTALKILVDNTFSNTVGRSKCVRLLLDHGAVVDWTDLLLSSVRDESDVTVMLLDKASPSVSLSFQGWKLARDGKWAEAEASYREAMSHEADDIRIRAALAYCLLAEKKYSEAETLYRDVVAHDSTDSNTRYLLAICLGYQGKYTGEEEQLREAIRLFDQYGMAYADLAACLFKQNRIEDAKPFARKAIELGVKDHWVYASLGITP
jgi:hypothetical protein